MFNHKKLSDTMFLSSCNQVVIPLLHAVAQGVDLTAYNT